MAGHEIKRAGHVLLASAELQSHKASCLTELQAHKTLLSEPSLSSSGSLSSKSSIDMSMKSSSSSFGGAILSSSVKTSSSSKTSGEAITDMKPSTNVSLSNNSKMASDGLQFMDSTDTSFARSASSVSDASDGNESTYSTFSAVLNKPHKANDSRWEAIQSARIKEGNLGLNNFRLLKRLGCGDIGSVYLAELRGSNSYFAMKVMDTGSLATRKKLLRAQTEREILQSLDHPFLPSLYTHFETDKFSCLVMEFCSGGDLHTLRQRQAGKHFTEMAARFYAAEVLLSLEYLHMMGVIYRDLKPENVLVREDGHIMLSDFDLSLRCVVRPTLVKSASIDMDPAKRLPVYCVQPACLEPACVMPSCIQPPSFVPKILKSKKKSKTKSNLGNHNHLLPELMAEPTGARSLSFVGTHEYLAPEIIKGEGHGSAVDWWTFGIFLFELLHGRTPFKGAGNRATLFNVIGQTLKFPDIPTVSFAARDLIRGLLVKDPQHRIAYKRGATEIKQHPFFEGVNWALIRSMTPPEVPKPFEPPLNVASHAQQEKPGEVDSTTSGSYLDFDFI